MKVRKVIKEPGLNAAISVNVNEDNSRVTASSVQDADAEGSTGEATDTEDATELPDREGTYDELREAADRQANEGESNDG